MPTMGLVCSVCHREGLDLDPSADLGRSCGEEGCGGILVVEEWRTIRAFPAYSVSSCGRVRRESGGPGARPGRILSRHRASGRYWRVTLHRRGRPYRRMVHCLVAEAFLASTRPDSGEFVGFIDGDTLNPYVGNLEWRCRHAVPPGDSSDLLLLDEDGTLDYPVWQ